jgi:hypothetical protein
VPRIVTATVAALVVALTLSSGTRHTTPTSPQSAATCSGSARVLHAPAGAAGRCGDHDVAERMVAAATALPSPTSVHQNGALPSRVQPPPVNHQRALPELAVARTHDPAHLHAYVLLI